jgi:ParB family chromosome partitioning protein
MRIDDAKIRNSQDLQPRKGLIAKRASIFNDVNRSEIAYLSIDQLRPYKKQARKIFNEEELQSLALTIKEHGIRQPLTVLQIDADQAIYEVISGERRLRAAKIAGLSKLPCIILPNSEKAEEIALVENIQRQDLHPIELARALKKISETRGWGGQKEMQEKLGLTKSTISELLKLTELSSEVQEEVLEKNVRGRELFRKLFSLTSDTEKLRFIEEHDKKRNMLPSSKRSNSISHSVLRISLSSGQLKVQKAGISTLSLEEKENVKKTLEKILQEICL